MKIVLLRHGEPEIDLSRMLKMKCAAGKLKPLLSAYTLGGLNNQKKPTAEALLVTKSCKAFACSDLPRSIESAYALGVTKIDIIDPVFRESDMPHAQWRYPTATLFTWAILFRALQFLGYSKNGEPVSSLRQRSDTAAAQLKQMAKIHNTAMLVGHGFFNRFVSKKLRSNGWSGPKHPGNDYWDYGVYEYGAAGQRS